MTFNLLLESGENGDYQEVKRFQVNRSNNALHVGFVQYAPVVVSFSPTSGKSFRLTIDGASREAGITELILSATPRVGHYIEKTLAKMNTKHLPYWHEYQIGRASCRERVCQYV